MTSGPTDRLAGWADLDEAVRARLRDEHDRDKRRRLWRALAESWRILGHPQARVRAKTTTEEDVAAGLDRVFGVEAVPVAPTLDEVLARSEPEMAELVARAQRNRRRGPSPKR